MSKFSRWFNSKTGKRTVAGALALALVVAIVGQLVNWCDLIPGAGTVIVIPPTEPYPAPEANSSFRRRRITARRCVPSHSIRITARRSTNAGASRVSSAPAGLVC